MSRDWTPRELYEVEQYNIRNGHGSLWDFMKNATWIINGEQIPFCTEEKFAHRQEFPILGRLYDRFDALYAFLSGIDGGIAFLSRYESELSRYIETGEGDKTSALLRWFEGTLDERFYYCERNDDLLMESIQNEVKELPRLESPQEKRSLDTQIENANNRSSTDNTISPPTREDRTLNR